MAPFTSSFEDTWGRVLSESRRQGLDRYLLIIPIAVLLLIFMLLASPQLPSSFPVAQLLPMSRTDPGAAELGHVACLLDANYELRSERAMLQVAEGIYRANLEKRQTQLGTLQPLGLDEMTMRVAMLIPTYPCPVEDRIGVWADGGKWLCKMKSFLPDSPIVYSIGCNGEYSFEQAVYKTLNTKAHTFDPFINEQQQQMMLSLDFVNYSAIGLAAVSNVAAVRAANPSMSFETLPGLMRKNGHSYIDVLKIDCEGCEESVLFDIRHVSGEDRQGQLYPENFTPMPMPTPAIGQILVELHKLNDPSITLPLIYHLENIGYRLFHFEPNPQCGTCSEFAFIHESLLFPHQTTTTSRSSSSSSSSVSPGEASEEVGH